MDNLRFDPFSTIWGIKSKGGYLAASSLVFMVYC